MMTAGIAQCESTTQRGDGTWDVRLENGERFLAERGRAREVAFPQERHFG